MGLLSDSGRRSRRAARCRTWPAPILVRAAINGTAGRHLYAASPQKDVRIEDEALVFRVQRPTGFIHYIVVEVTADYTLANGGKARDLVIGFPIGGPNSAEGKISSFQVRGDGVGARVVIGVPEQMDWVGKALPAECESDAKTPAPLSFTIGSRGSRHCAPDAIGFTFAICSGGS